MKAMTERSMKLTEQEWDQMMETVKLHPCETSQELDLLEKDEKGWLLSLKSKVPIPIFWEYFKNPNQKGYLEDARELERFWRKGEEEEIEDLPAAWQICLNEELEGTKAAFKTALHELTHYYQHAERVAYFGYSHNEIEAEAVAHLICKRLGYDTTLYSIGYMKEYGEELTISILQKAKPHLFLAWDYVWKYVADLKETE